MKWIELVLCYDSHADRKRRSNNSCGSYCFNLRLTPSHLHYFVWKIMFYDHRLLSISKKLRFLDRWQYWSTIVTTRYSTEARWYHGEYIFFSPPLLNYLAALFKYMAAATKLSCGRLSGGCQIKKLSPWHQRASVIQHSLLKGRDHT